MWFHFIGNLCGREKIFLLSLLGLAACTRSQVPQDTLAISVSSNFGNLDPLQSTDANIQKLNELVHGALFRMGPNLIPEPELAESYRFINDTTLEIKLKKNCFFSSGKRLTAKDVKSSWHLYTDDRLKSPFKEAFSKIQNIEIENENIIRITSRDPYPALLTNLVVLKVIPSEEYNSETFSQAPVGAGILKIVHSDTSKIILEKNPHTCLGPKPSWNRLLVKTVRDELSRFLQLKTKELDLVVNELNFRKVELVQQGLEPSLRAQVAPGILYNYIGINFAEPKLQDIRVRQALAHSFDLDTLIKYKSRGFAKRAKSILASSSFFANQQLANYEFHPEKAKELLDQAGYYNTKNQKPILRLKLLVNNNQAVIDNARILTDQAKSVGIDLQARPYEWGTFMADVKNKNTQLYLLRWVGATDPGIYADNFHSGTLGRSNRTNYKNPSLDPLIEKAEVTIDPIQRRQLYWQIQKIVHDDLGYISLWHGHNAVVYGKQISGLEMPPNASWRMFLSVKKSGAHE